MTSGRFVAAARERGLEVALDLAYNCAPDHPWVTEHPDWFTTLPDGSIAFAENPPKKYQDIYPLNFDNDPAGLYAELLRVVRLWISHGVSIFRVDNPHTKPIDFWEWLIAQVRRTNPEVIFLAEAFTAPPMLHELARVGFSQSYTYFIWRTGKAEITEYGKELIASATYLRPNFFVNTPDILHASLQFGGPADVRHPGDSGRNAVPVLGHVLGLRTLRKPGRRTRQRGIPGFREVPIAAARFRAAHSPRAARCSRRSAS